MLPARGECGDRESSESRERRQMPGEAKGERQRFHESSSVSQRLFVRYLLFMCTLAAVPVVPGFRQIIISYE